MATVNSPKTGSQMRETPRNVWGQAIQFFRGQFGAAILGISTIAGVGVAKGPDAVTDVVTNVSHVFGSKAGDTWQNNPNIEPPEYASRENHENHQDAKEQESNRFENSLEELRNTALAAPRRLNAYFYMAAAMSHNKVEDFSEEDMQKAKTMAVEVFQASGINNPEYTRKLIDNYTKNVDKENDKYRQYTDFIQ